MRKPVGYIWDVSLKWISQMVKISQKLEQKQQLSPQQILQASLLQLSLPLLEQRILQELEINPALEMNELPNKSEGEEILEEKPDSEEEIEFDWEELLGVNDEYEYPKKWEKEDMTLKIFMRKKLKEKWIERILYIYEECWHKNITEYKKEIESSEAESEAGKLFSNISLYFSSLYNAILSTDDLSKELNDLTKNLFEDTDTIYKKAVDANYASDKSAYGGPYHRLFDDSHSIGKMYEKIKDAKPDDSKLEEIFAWVNEAAKDFQTTMGLPIVSMEKETFDSMASFLKPVGINKNDLYDVLTGNLQEFLGAAFLGITSLIPSIKKDKKRLRSLKGVMVASGAFGNPFALILLLMTLVYSMVKGDTKQFKEDLMSKEAISGFAITAIIKYAFDYLGAKIVLTLLGILLGLMLVVYFIRHRKNINVDLEKFKKEFVKELETLREMSKKQLEKENIKLLPKND